MEWPQLSGDARSLLALLAGALILSTVLGLLLMFWVLWRVRRLRIPPDADFMEAMRLTPFVVVLVLDLLDFGLDFLSAPIAWVFLTRLGLHPLRGAAVVEELIPGTQFIPTMTLAWLLVRVFGLGRGRRFLSR